MAAPEVEVETKDEALEAQMAKDAAEEAKELAEVAGQDLVNEESKANLASALAGKLQKGTVDSKAEKEEAAELANLESQDLVNEESKANLANALAGKLQKGKVDSQAEKDEAAELAEVSSMDCVNEDSKAKLAGLLGAKKSATIVAPVTDDELQQMKGKFHNLSVILEQLPLFDLIVTSPTPLRIWCMGKTNKDWKPDTTQLDAGAKIQITQIMKVDGISAKGWNEHSSYYLGCIGGNKWIRLINFRGVATVIPDIETFQGRVAGAAEKINSMQQMVESEQQRRQAAEARLLNAETRVTQMEEARVSAETRVQELEAAMKSQGALTTEKVEMAAKQSELATKEATEAGVLMR